MSTFETDRTYKRSEVWKFFGLNEKKTKGGAYATGYAWVDKNLIVFANINVAGRTGHDYQNVFDGNNFIWWSKTRRTESSPEIVRMLLPESNIYVFYRYDDKADWNHWGIADVVGKLENKRIQDKNGNDVSCVKIVLRLKSNQLNTNFSNGDEISFIEGKSKQVFVNVYERNNEARKACIKHYGPKCQICNIDFGLKYPSIGNGFIHVHHLKMVSEINSEYKVNPISDLIPVCPNCHAMIHQRKIPYTISEMKKIIFQSDKI